MLERITGLREFQALCERINDDRSVFGSLGLLRAAHYAVSAAFYEDLNRPVLYLTAKPDQALLALDEIAFWDPGSDRFIFPAPEPHFYENAAWSMSVRHDRIQTLTQLTKMLLPGTDKPDLPP